MKKKTELRTWAKNIRKTLKMDEISKGIVSNIKNSEVYLSANNVMLFYPLNTEINLLDLMEDDKTFYLPRVKGSDLEVCPYKKGDALKVSDYKIKEPVSEAIMSEILDIVFVPALCADMSFYRLGYGGGFYDRFCRNLEAKKIIVIPDELVIEAVPSDKYDVRCDGIITQKKASF